VRNLLVGFATDVGLVRDRNEDAYFAASRCYAVADGMGGHKAGEVASEIAIEVVASEYEERGSVDFDIAHCISKANRRVIQASRNRDELEGMGTTLTVVTLCDGVLRVGHVGDSRAYLLRADSVVQLTEDHSVVGELLRSGLLTPEEAECHPQRHAITRALGFSENLDIDMGEHQLVPGDAVLLCTDGLHDIVADDEIAQTVSMWHDPDEACMELVKLARARGGHDNITVVLVRTEESDIPSSNLPASEALEASNASDSGGRRP
jgi:serine/threonine protein phosphatase PrpC